MSTNDSAIERLEDEAEEIAESQAQQREEEYEEAALERADTEDTK